MLLLQSYEKFAELATMESVAGSLQKYSRSAHPELASAPIAGVYCELHGRTLYLLRAAGHLYFRVDDQVIELDDATSVKLTRTDTQNTLVVLRESKVMFEWSYPRPLALVSVEDDPTPFVDEEDFDFCLLLRNVVNDPARKARMYEQEVRS